MSTCTPERAAERTLLEIAQAAEPFCSNFRQPFFALPLGDGARQAYPIRSGVLAHWLTAKYFHQCGTPPPDSALRRVLRTLEARAYASGRREPVYQRLGWLPYSFAGPTIFLNLANDAGEIIAIDAERWQIIPDLNAHFATYRRQLPLPRPPDPSPDSLQSNIAEFQEQKCFEPDLAAIARLRSFLPCDEPDWHKCLAWLLAAFRPSIPYPILILQGPPASGKSTAARLLRSLIDPSSAPLLELPFSPRGLYTLASRQWIAAFDYVSEIPRPASRALCRLSTGADHDFRDCGDRLDPMCQDLRRPVLITATPELTLRPGLAARALVARFPDIPLESRRTEGAIWEEFERHAPSILAALCSAASVAMGRLAGIQLPKTPVCADAAAWVAAAAPALGVPEEQLLAAFDPVDPGPDPVAVALTEFMQDRSEWRGSASALLDELCPNLGASAPATPKGLSERLSTFPPGSLRIDPRRSNGRRRLTVTHRVSKCGT